MSCLDLMPQGFVVAKGVFPVRLRGDVLSGVIWEVETGRKGVRGESTLDVK